MKQSMLQISHLINEGYYTAKIVGDTVRFTNPFIDKNGEEKVVAKILVQIEGSQPFEAAVWHDDIYEFASKMSIGDDVTVHIYINSKKNKRAAIQPIDR